MVSYQCSLDEATLRKSYEELNEKPEWRMRDIEAVRQLCQKSSGLNSCLDDAFLVRFLRARKFEYDGTLELIRNYYQQRALNPAVFGNFTPSSIKRILDNGWICVLPKKDHIGRQLILLRPGKWDPTSCSFTELVKCLAVCLEYLIVDEAVQVHGFVFIVDSSGFGWQHLRVAYPSELRAAVRILQDAFPSRTKEIHFIHEPRAFGITFGIMSALFKEKIRKRIHFHGSNFTSLHAGISPDLLPDDPAFRGKVPGPMRNDAFIKELMDSEEEFKRLSQFGIDLSTLQGPQARAGCKTPYASESFSVENEAEFNDAVSELERVLHDQTGADGNTKGLNNGNVGGKQAGRVPGLADFQKRLSNCTSWMAGTSYRKWFGFGNGPNAAKAVKAGDKNYAASKNANFATAPTNLEAETFEDAEGDDDAANANLPCTPEDSTIEYDSSIVVESQAVGEDTQNV